MTTSTTLSTLCRGTGIAESGGPKVRLQATEMTFESNSLDRKTSIRRTRGSRRRAPLPQTYSTRRGMMLLYPNSLFQKKSLLEGKKELGNLESTIFADSEYFSAEFEKWADAVLGEGGSLSSEEDEDFDILTDLAGSKVSQNPLPMLLSADTATFSNAPKGKKIRPGLSARRYLINLAEGAESRMNCNWKGKGYVSDSTFFEANAANPELKRKVKADLTEMPEPYSLSHFLLPAMPLHVSACDCSLSLMHENSDYDIFPTDDKDEAKKGDQGKENETDDKKVTLPQIKKPADYGKLSLDAKRTLLVDRLIQAAISMAIRKHKELFETFLKSHAIYDDDNEESKKRAKMGESDDISGELKSAPWFDFNDVLTAIAYQQQYRRERAKAKLRGRQQTKYDGNPETFTAPFSTYLRPRLLGGSKPTVTFQRMPDKVQQKVSRQFTIPHRTERFSTTSVESDLRDDEELVAPELINCEAEPSKTEISKEETSSNGERTSILGRLFAEGASPEMKRIFQSIPVEIFEAVEEDLVQNLARHANRIAKSVLAKPGNGKILEKDTKLALEMWTTFLLEPIPQPPTLSSKTHTTLSPFTRGDTHNLAPSSSPRFSGGARTRSSSKFDFEQKTPQNEDDRSPVVKQPRQQAHVQPLDFHGPQLDFMPDQQTSTVETSPKSTSRTVVTKEFKGAFDLSEKQETQLPPKQGSSQSHVTPKMDATKVLHQKKDPSETSFHHEKPTPEKLQTPPRKHGGAELPSVVPVASGEREDEHSETSSVLQQAQEEEKQRGQHPQQKQEEKKVEKSKMPAAPPVTTASTAISDLKQPSVAATAPQQPIKETASVPTAVMSTMQGPTPAGKAATTGPARPVLVAVSQQPPKPPTAVEQAPETTQVAPMPTIPAKFVGPALPSAAAVGPARSVLVAATADAKQPPQKQAAESVQAAQEPTVPPSEATAASATTTTSTIPSIPTKFTGPTPQIGPQRPVLVIAAVSDSQKQQDTATAVLPAQEQSNKEEPVESNPKTPNESSEESSEEEETNGEESGEEEVQEEPQIQAVTEEEQPESTLEKKIDEKTPVTEATKARQAPAKKVDSSAEGGTTKPPAKKQTVGKADSTKPAAGEKQKRAKETGHADALPDHTGEETQPVATGSEVEQKVGDVTKTSKKEKKPKKEKAVQEKPFVTGIPEEEKAKFLEGEGAKKKKGKKGKKKKGQEEAVEGTDALPTVQEEQQPSAEAKSGSASSDEYTRLEGAIDVQVNFKRGKKEQAAGQRKKLTPQVKTKTEEGPAATEEPPQVAGEDETGRLSKVTEVTDASPTTGTSSPSKLRRKSTLQSVTSEQSEPDFVFVSRSPTASTIKPPSSQKAEEEKPKTTELEKTITSLTESTEPVTATTEAADQNLVTEPEQPLLTREEMIKRKREAVEAKRRERRQKQEEEQRLAEEESAKKDGIHREIDREAREIEEAARAEFERRLEEKMLEEIEAQDRAVEAERVEQFEQFIAEQEKAKLEDFKTKFQEELKRRRTSRALRRLESKAVEGMEAFGLWLTDDAVMSEILPPVVVEEPEGENEGEGQGKRMSMQAHKIAMEARRRAVEAERKALLQGYRRLTASAWQRKKMQDKRIEHWGLMYHQFRLTRAFVWSYFSLLQWLRFDNDTEKLPSIDEF